MKKIILLLSTVCSFFLPLSGEIVKTNHIEDIIPQVGENTLVLFNIAEVLMDTESSLGSQAWRKYVRSRLDAPLHDALTLFVFQHVPPKTPEPVTANLVAELQQNGIPVFAFTSRGRTEWYSTQISGVDLITEQLLKQITIDFSQTELEHSFSNIEKVFGDYFHHGIIYATNVLDKGEVLIKFLEAAHFHPAKVLFVDDKADSLASVEQALQEVGIRFIGFAYSRTALEHAKFDPMIAHIQLDWLLSTGQCPSDEEASRMKALQDPTLDPEVYFSQIIEKWKRKNLSNSL